MKTLYLDCFSGISGDMFLSLLLDLGLSPEELKTSLGGLKIDPFNLHIERVQKGPIAATHVRFHINETHEDRSLKEIFDLIDRSRLSSVVKENSKKVFQRLGEAEAHVHGVSLNNIHFHEVGAMDSILDIVGVCIGLEALGIAQIYHSPVPVGLGKTTVEHGLIPIPGPATLELLKGKPIYEGDVKDEVTTPTGAALLASLTENDAGPMPHLVVEKIGYGAGTKNFECPNVLRGILGHRVPFKNAKYILEPITLLEANIDDLQPEVYDYLIERLLKEGALDVFLEPIQMKKNRPAQKLSVTAFSEKIEALAEVIFRETTTLGIRVHESQRFTLNRKARSLQTPWGKIRLKIALWGDEIVNIKPEYEDCKRIAEVYRIPLKRVDEEISARVQVLYKTEEHGSANSEFLNDL